MTKGVKIALGIGIPLALGSVYWFGIRNRRPALSFQTIDWLNKKGEVQFGFSRNTFSLNKATGGIEAGKTFSNKYRLNIQPQSGDKIVFTVTDTKSGNVVETRTIDFKSKLEYYG